VIDFVRAWSDRTQITTQRLVVWLGIAASKYYDRRQRHGKVNEHNAWLPRDAWLMEQEKQAIMDFQRHYPLEGYRRLAFMMPGGTQTARRSLIRFGTNAVNPPAGATVTRAVAERMLCLTARGRSKNRAKRRASSRRSLMVAERRTDSFDGLLSQKDGISNSG